MPAFPIAPKIHSVPKIQIGPLLRKINLLKLVRSLVAAAELLFPPKSGSIRKAWVVQQINARVDVPGLDEDQEAEIIELLIELAVEEITQRG